jgi:hypothetical protein
MAGQKSKMSNYAARLVPTIREKAEEICRREGISLNQFLKLTLMRQITFFERQGEPRLSQRLSQQEAIAVLKKFLNRRHSEAPLPGDELPSPYKAPVVRQKKHSNCSMLFHSFWSCCYKAGRGVPGRARRANAAATSI